MSGLTEPYWEGCKAGELRLQCCDSCGKHQHYPRSICKHCWGRDLSWRTASGRGTLYSYAIAVTATYPSLVDRVPYVIAIVELEEGPRLTSMLVNCAHEDIQIGMPLTAAYDDDLHHEHTMLVFEPTES